MTSSILQASFNEIQERWELEKESIEAAALQASISKTMNEFDAQFDFIHTDFGVINFRDYVFNEIPVFFSHHFFDTYPII